MPLKTVLQAYMFPNIAFTLLAAGTLLSGSLHATAPDTNEYSIPGDSNTTSLETFFTDADTFYHRWVVKGKVDYAGIEADRAGLDALYAFIGAADLSTADKNTQTAFYINAYNLVTIYSVVSKLPISSPLDVTGFFDAKKHQVAGSYMTLNELENKKLRPDARVHFVLVCAANGCPKLQSEAYIPSKVQDQMNAATRAAMNDNTFIRVSHDGKKVMISQIFDWYKDDFIQSEGSDMAFINKYRNTKIPDTYTKEFYPYDWKLNKQ